MDFLFSEALPALSPLRAKMLDYYRKDENTCVQELLQAVQIPESVQQRIITLAHRLVIEVRQQQISKGGVDAFMHEYDLSSEEGVALMCLAEAMLRTPDSKNIDLLIKDKLSHADWQAHLSKSSSLFVNAASWGLMLTGKFLSPKQTNSNYLGKILHNFFAKTSEPIIRQALAYGMKILGKQFVMGTSIEDAIKRSKEQEKNGYLFSYDMLGEAARTAEDAERYLRSYEHAIIETGKHANSEDVFHNPGVSVKLSALYPRYEFAQKEIAVPLLTERLLFLAQQAKNYHIGLTVDAEEADRLDISLDILEAVMSHPSLAGWNGLGLAMQAYQKRAFYVIDWLADLARRTKHRIMLRLVKGAYWDYEIKDSQVKGLNDYPVFTRKVSTDLSYLACIQKIIMYGDLFYPQFATHNAYHVAAVIELMKGKTDFEFQCLKGMGRTLYDEILKDEHLRVPVRVYAPVGHHQDLLPYLVRRLLENGANTSFVNRIVDHKMPIEELIAHPWEKLATVESFRHPRIPLPVNLYGEQRKNSRGIDLSNPEVLNSLRQNMQVAARQEWVAKPATVKNLAERECHTVLDPTNNKHIVGKVYRATKEDLDVALEQAHAAYWQWDQMGVEARAAILEKVADLFEENYAELMTLIVREAGKTIPDAVGEVREAVDYCRYYAQQARLTLSTKIMPGPTGEHNELQMHGRGVALCISPWNFPLAIFAGQVTAALAAGNAVIAKPAEPTSLIAARAVELMHQAGVPTEVLHLLPGKGSVIGAAAVADERIAVVMMTGSTETARNINKTLANRTGPIIPLIAETGGQNAMIADSTALPEQLVVDVISSSFLSAGQRCSALRVLFVQNEIADRTIAMLKGAMAELKVSDPGFLPTDIGPIINDGARSGLEEHAALMDKEAKLIYQVPVSNKETQYGSYFAPRAYELPDISYLKREVFGPVLHVIRYNSSDLDKVIEAINSTGYGLTAGVQTRIDANVDYIQKRIHAGNMYINRNMIGAVVGVQPFGGEGLSGTGPKAGGPHYLLRLCHERTLTINTTAAGGNASLLTLSE